MSEGAPSQDPFCVGGATRFTKRVPDPAHRLDQPRLAALLGLAAQVADVDLERVRARAEVVPPDRLEELGAAEHEARVAHQVLEQRELGLGELDRPLASVNLAGGRVESEVRVSELLGRRRRSSGAAAPAGGRAVPPGRTA